MHLLFWGECVPDYGFAGLNFRSKIELSLVFYNYCYIYRGVALPACMLFGVQILCAALLA